MTDFIIAKIHQSLVKGNGDVRVKYYIFFNQLDDMDLFTQYVYVVCYYRPHLPVCVI